MPVNLITLVIIAVAALILIELFKHLLFKKIYRFFLFTIVFIVLLVILIGYLASKNIVSDESKFVATGAAILEDVTGNIDKETISNITSPIQKIDKEGLRKLYK